VSTTTNRPPPRPTLFPYTTLFRSDVMQMINFSIEETAKGYKGLVIGNQGKNFCVGANLALMLMEAQDDNFFELDMVVRKFQDMRSEEHTSELQSRFDLVCRLLLEK